MDRIVLPAPAKINLGLRIRGRRPDGYHLLESLFLPLDLADEVEVAEAPSFALRVEGDASGVPSGGENLAARAVRAFCRTAGLPESFRVRLRKRIPSGGGLGGGSSDAAAVLRALVRLRPGAVAARELYGLALSLGADVPFFLDPRAALVEGVGEEILPVSGVPSLSLVLLHPGPPLATADVYRAYDAAADSLTPGGAAPTIRRLLALRSEGRTARTRVFEVPSVGAGRAAGAGAIGGIAGLLQELIVNDLEPAAIRLCPAVGALREEIQATGPLAVGMSGSGPTVFGVYAGADEARTAAERLRAASAAARLEAAPRRTPRHWLARTVSSEGAGFGPAAGSDP